MSETENFSKQSRLFQKTLNSTFHQCFQKIRITNKTSTRTKPEDEIDQLLDLKSNLQELSNCAKSPLSVHFVQVKIEILEERIMKLTALKNNKMIKEYTNKLGTPEGSF